MFWRHKHKYGPWYEINRGKLYRRDKHIGFWIEQEHVCECGYRQINIERAYVE